VVVCRGEQVALEGHDLGPGVGIAPELKDHVPNTRETRKAAASSPWA
jgi:hypothetical protein